MLITDSISLAIDKLRNEPDFVSTKQPCALAALGHHLSKKPDKYFKGVCFFFKGICFFLKGYVISPIFIGIFYFLFLYILIQKRTYFGLTIVTVLNYKSW